MRVWQADIYQRQETAKNWSLLICDSQGTIIHQASCSQVTTNWLMSQVEIASKIAFPHLIQVFRPQSLQFFTPVVQQLGIELEATRRTPALKAHLRENQINIDLDKPPPQALPAHLWGEKWQFVSFPAADLLEFFQERPLPIMKIESELLPLNLGIASTVSIPGIVIYGGKQSMYLARWLEAENPVSINYISQESGKSGGLVLESALVNRWILATFEDVEVAQAAERYERRKQDSKGLHFLVVQPDDSGMTYTGFWLLKTES